MFAIGIVLSAVWLWLNMYISPLAIVSSWPWEMLRWTAYVESFNYFVAIYTFFAGAIGYGIGWLKVTNNLP